MSGTFALARGPQNIIAGLLLLGYSISALTAVSTKCATTDEGYHLAGGYSYWKLGDFRLQPENGNLPQRWSALLLLGGDYTFPSLEQEAWRRSDKVGMSDQFLYDLGNDADRTLLLGRLMCVFMGVGLGALVFAWTRRLLGPGAAFLSLTLFVFCPTMLANGPLVTSDMTASLFFLASVGAIWVVLRSVTWKSLLLSSLVMGGLFLSKFSAFIIEPMGLMLMAVQLASNHPLLVTWGQKTWRIHSRAARIAMQSAIVGVHAIVIWAMIWGCYHFRYETFHSATVTPGENGQGTIDEFGLHWEDLSRQSSPLVNMVILQARQWRLLPEAYLYGFSHSYSLGQSRPAFLNGDFRKTGWRYFFPYCLLVKTPLPMFVLVMLGGAAVWRGWRGGPDSSAEERRVRRNAALYRTAPLWVLFVVYWAFAITSHLNIGHRHILPAYSPMIMLAGAAALWSRRQTESALEQAVPISRMGTWQHPAVAVLVCGCLVTFATESLLSWPNYLAYFNQIAGGPRNGYRHLVDSSLDWGQDLPSLRAWFHDQRPTDSSPGKIYLAYTGLARPEYYGIHAVPLPHKLELSLGDMPERLEAGTYCLTATALQCVYTSFPGRWNREYEQSYWMLRGNMQAWKNTARDPAARERLTEELGGIKVWETWFKGYEQLRFSRLCSFLRHREADAQINYSMLIYRLSEDDLASALDGAPAELQEPAPQQPRLNN